MDVAIVMVFWVLLNVLSTMITKLNKEKDCARFAVMTDMHYYPASLVNRKSTAYQEYLKQDAKLTEESGAVIVAAIDDMINENVEFVILAGDLTNEGEKESHLKLANILKRFSENNIKVFVTPGNHDINNGLSYSFTEDEKKKVPSITPFEFEDIYRKFGFENAYSRDSETLSYCCRIKDGFNIITIDANQYKRNKQRPLPDGVLQDSTIEWAEREIKSSIERGERIIGVIHHGIVEHFKDQGKTFAPFLVKNFDSIAERLSNAGLDFVFTGHLHAQDISKKMYGEHTIYDIETAALTSAPFAWRLCCVDNAMLSIETRYIENIDFDYGSELPFREWAMKRVYSGLLELESFFLKNYNGLTEDQAELAAPYYARAFMAHFCGDEKPQKEDEKFYLKHINNPKSPYYEVSKIFFSLWEDLPDSDNNLTIQLRKINE